MDPESHLKFGLRILLMALFAMMASFAYGQSREAIQYEYDGAGNIIRIETAFSENPPSITNISPNVLRIGPTVSMTATGADLQLARITAADPAITISNVSISPGTVSFDIGAANNAQLGPTDINFTTALEFKSSLKTKIADLKSARNGSKAT